jgi:hypothetical protein
MIVSQDMARSSILGGIVQLVEEDDGGGTGRPVDTLVLRLPLTTGGRQTSVSEIVLTRIDLSSCEDTLR